MLGQAFIRSACQDVRQYHAATLKHSFFNIVNIEEKLHFTWRMTELRNVSLKIFLDLLRKIAKPKATHLVIPFNDRSLILLRGVFSNPAINLFISRAGCNELF